MRHDPRTVPWPTLTDAERAAIQALIDQGKRQDALDLLVSTLQTKCCNFGDISGTPIYEPRDPSKGGLDGDGDFNPSTKEVRLGQKAFRPNNPPATCGVAWLYSTLKHELVHAAQWTDPKNAEKQGSDGREYQAYRLELANAKATGICPDERKDLAARCQEASRLRNDPNCK